MSRGTIIGFLAGALVAVALGVLYLHPWHTAANPGAAAPPVQKALPAGPKFAVRRQIGAWTLECLKPTPLPDWARASMGIKKAPSAERKPLHCRVFVRAAPSTGARQWVDFILGSNGPTRILNIHMKLASGLASAGDVLELNMDSTKINVRVLLCGKDDCVAVPMRRSQDLVNVKQTAGEQLLSAKSASLVFPVSAGGKPVTVNIPMTGLPRNSWDGMPWFFIQAR